MPKSPIERVRELYAAVSAGDRGRAFRDLPPDFLLRTPDRVPNAGTYVGPEETMRFFDDFWSPFEEVQVEPEELLESGDRVAAFLRVRVRHHGSTAFVENRVAAVWTVRDGQPIECVMYPEPAKAREAIGRAGEPAAGS